MLGIFHYKVKEEIISTDLKNSLSIFKREFLNGWCSSWNVWSLVHFRSRFLNLWNLIRYFLNILYIPFFLSVFFICRFSSILKVISLTVVRTTWNIVENEMSSYLLHDSQYPAVVIETKFILKIRMLNSEQMFEWSLRLTVDKVNWQIFLDKSLFMV